MVTAERLLTLKRAHVNVVAKPRRVVYSGTHLSKCASTLTRRKVRTSPRLVARNSFAASNNCTRSVSLLGQPGHPATVFTNDSLRTVNICRTTERLKLHVPRSLSIIKFSSIRATTFLNPTLAAMQRPLRSVTETTMHVLIRTLSASIVRPRVVVPASLIMHGDARRLRDWSTKRASRTRPRKKRDTPDLSAHFRLILEQPIKASTIGRPRVP